MVKITGMDISLRTQPRFLLFLLPILTVGLASCADTGLRTGIKPVLDVASVQNAASNQTAIINALVLDAGYDPQGSVNYYDVAQAGFNYVDDQCTAYFDYMFFFDRRRNEIQSGLAAAGATTGAILGLTNASTMSLGIVASAFGFASNATDIVAGTYVFGHPAETMVLVNRLQTAFRNGAAKNHAFINSRTSAYYAIQRYLSLCLPPTIEGVIANQISATTAVGVPAGEGSLVSVQTGSSLAPPGSSRPARHAPLIGPAPLTRQEVSATRITSPTSTITNGPRTPDQLEKTTKSFTFQVQAALCVPKSEIDGTLNSATVQSVGDFLRAINRPVPEKIDILALQPFLAKAVQDVPNCTAAGFENPFEVAIYGIPADRTSHKITTLQTNILNFLKLNGSNTTFDPSGKFDPPTRKAIAEARRIAVDKKLLPSTEEGEQLDKLSNDFFH